MNVVIAGALITFVHANPRASAAMGIDDMQIPMVDRLAALNLFLATSFPPSRWTAAVCCVQRPQGG